MATQTAFSPYTTTLTTIMSTDLNALSNAAYVLGTVAVVDNTSALDLWADFQLNVDFVSAPTAGTSVDLYLVPSVDGTNYADAAVAQAPYYVGSFPMSAVTPAQIAVIRQVPLGPGKFKPAVVNGSGQAFPATGTTVQFRSYHLTNT